MARKIFGEYLLLKTGETNKLLIDSETEDVLLLKAVANGNRSKRILGKVQLILKGSVNENSKMTLNIPEEVFYDIMGDYATKIAQETLSIERREVVEIASSEIQEPDGFFRGKLIQLDTNLSLQMIEIDLEDYDNLSRYTFTGCAQTPLYYKRWNGTITLYPSVTTDYYPMYYWAIPTTTPSSTVDPETPIQYDKAIEYGMISEMALMIDRKDLADRYNLKYEREIQKSIINQSKTISRPLVLQSHE